MHINKAPMIHLYIVSLQVKILKFFKLYVTVQLRQQRYFATIHLLSSLIFFFFLHNFSWQRWKNNSIMTFLFMRSTSHEIFSPETPSRIQLWDLQVCLCLYASVKVVKFPSWTYTTFSIIANNSTHFKQ